MCIRDSFGTRQFLMKSLFWIETGQLAFRFNLAVFNKKIDEIGKALSVNSVYKKPTLFLRGCLLYTSRCV